MVDLSTIPYFLFAVSAGFCLFLQLLNRRTRSEVSSGNNPQFRKFQHKFILVYFLALFSDWLQGPYIYKLYSSYGFAKSQIAVLYVVGFASSVIFGTGTGTLTDKFGRRRICISFCVVYIICCLTKLSSNFNVLVLGRVCGGIATSILFSAFESWYVYEHIERYEFPSEWLPVTFSKVTFWNGVLAIGAGVVAYVTAELNDWGPISPFLFAIPVLLTCLVVIANTWEENYGNRQLNFSKSCIEGLRYILFDEQILLLGIIQSLFESVMYMFVFMWTPILDVGGPPLGIVFATFMVCTMIGSATYKLLISRSFASKHVLGGAVSLSFISMLMCYADTHLQSVVLSLAAFLLLEVAVGMYYPSVSVVRSTMIPESHRASILSWFRLPMNIMTCMGLLLLHHEENQNGNNHIFAICCFLMALALLAHARFLRVYRQNVDLSSVDVS